MTLDSTLAQFGKRSSLYFGTVTYDQVSNIDPIALQGKFVYVNMVTSSEAPNGKLGHFVCIDCTNRPKGANGTKEMYFFNSYGNFGRRQFDPDYSRVLMGLPPGTKIMDLMKSFTSTEANRDDALDEAPYQYNTTQFQAYALGNDICGVFCFVFSMMPLFSENSWLRIDYGLNNAGRLIMNVNLSKWGIKYGLLPDSSQIQKFIQKY